MARPKQPHLEVARPLQAAYGPEDERGAQLRAVGGEEGEEGEAAREGGGDAPVDGRARARAAQEERGGQRGEQAW